MRILEKIRRHSAVASGDFAKIFKQVAPPPLPAAATRLIAEINRPDPDPAQLVKVISAMPDLSAHVMRTVNSSFFSLQHRVTSVAHAVTLLGLRHIRPIALSFTMIGAVPRPEEALFDHEGFWTDSLVRALLARSFARTRKRGEEEEAFTAMLLADVALPVLLSSWQEYYAPVVERWQESTDRLSNIERHDFRWDHAQAGAWILESWGLPEELVCFVGVHNLSVSQLRELGLDDTIAVTVATASLAPSMLKPDLERAKQLVDAAAGTFSLSEGALAELITGVRKELEELRGLFGLQSRNVATVFNELMAAASTGKSEVLT
jgi:HD-like signal output (HDOD) protein